MQFCKNFPFQSESLGAFSFSNKQTKADHTFRDTFHVCFKLYFTEHVYAVETLLQMPGTPIYLEDQHELKVVIDAARLEHYTQSSAERG